MSSDRFHLIDTTLRDGDQAPGVIFDRANKIAIAQALIAARVPELEVGIPAMSREAVDDVNAVSDAISGRARLITWCRATPADIASARSCRVCGVHLSFPVSELHLRIWRKTPDGILTDLDELTAAACEHFDQVTVGAQDASRADAGFLAEFAAATAQTPASRLRVADTVGILTPQRTTELIDRIHHAAPSLPLEMHAHNDLGLATANTLAALLSHASAASVTVNGLGERAGNAALEEVVMALKVAEGIECGIDSMQFAELCALVSRTSSRPMPAGKPIVGGSAFLHESGVHCAGQLRDARSYEPFPPTAVGRSPSRFVLGTHTGGAAVASLLRGKGIVLSDDDARSLAARVRVMARNMARPLTVNDACTLLHT